MMDWLSGWLKEIIVVVLFAAFVELLLPNNAYQRYVRTVLGLFILLTLLSPLLSLFQQKWDTQKMLASVEQLNEAADPGNAFGTMKPLVAILQDAERWKQDDRNEAQRLMERQLASELQRSVGDGANVTIKQVRVQLGYDNNGTPALKQMRVILEPIDERPAAQPVGGTAAGRKPIAAIEPVQIEVRVGTTEPKPEPGKPTPEQAAAKQSIYEWLNREWQLNRSQVELLYETEQGGEG